jgi:two-component system response regulator AtoC
MSGLRVLIIDDDDGVRPMLSTMLRREGHEVRAASNGEEGLKELLANPWDLALCDVRMPVMGGLELLDEIRARGLSTAVIVMSAFGDRAVALEAIERGAYDYFDKPFKKDEVLFRVAKAAEHLDLKRENAELREATGGPHHIDGIIGESEPMRRVYTMIHRVAPHTTTVLVSGESGTGKELAARALHDLSPRADGPFVAINCGAIPEALLESELFGHVKGAFTDASATKLGKFQAADGGTVFLDEVGEMPSHLQVKLLRVLQDHEVTKVGATRPDPVDIRVVAATNVDLKAAVAAGDFRQDLYHRLDVVQIHMPPLRARGEDIMLLIEDFIAHQNATKGLKLRGVTDEALDMIRGYSWPGNVRELQNCIERGALLSMGDMIDAQSLPDSIRRASDELRQLFDAEELSIKKMTSALERILIRRALEQTKGNRTHAAELLEIAHRTLLYKIKEYGLGDVGK